jgi:hypothetical protein
MTIGGATSGGSKQTGSKALMRKDRQRRQRRYAVMVSVGFGVLLSVGVVVGISKYQSLKASRALPPSNFAKDDIQKGKITFNVAGDRCRQIEFGSDTGRVTEIREMNKPCEESAVDQAGLPKPAGTIHRLDAISKSFGK